MFKAVNAKNNFYSLYQFREFVRDRRNVFNDYTFRRGREYLNSYLVFEYNYFQGKCNLWIWIVRMGTNKVIVVETGLSNAAGRNKKKVWDLVSQAYNKLHEENQKETRQRV